MNTTIKVLIASIVISTGAFAQDGERAGKAGAYLGGGRHETPAPVLPVVGNVSVKASQIDLEDETYTITGEVTFTVDGDLRTISFQKSLMFGAWFDKKVTGEDGYYIELSVRGSKTKTYLNAELFQYTTTIGDGDKFIKTVTLSVPSPDYSDELQEMINQGVPKN